MKIAFLSEIVDSSKVGSMTGLVTYKNGKEVAKVKLRDGICTPTCKFNLLSIKKMMKEGCTVKGRNKYFVIEKDSVITHFDLIIKTRKGMFFCVNIQWSIGEINGASICISKVKAHTVLGHSREETTTSTAK